MESKIFISHGHDELAKHKLKDFIRDRLNMEPVVLGEQPDLGLTIVEKLEHYGKECHFALVLLTSDDETATGGMRARQNVIHELGYFHGLFGRKRVLLLKETGVELFSNISGLIYKEFPKGSLSSVFEDIRLAIESGDASKHAFSVPIESTSKYTDGDWITAAIVGPEQAEERLKKLAAGLKSLEASSRPEKLEQIVQVVQSAIDQLLEKHAKGGTTDETRLDACIAKIMADIMQRELTNFQWNIDEHPNHDPVTVFRDTVKAFIKSERNRWKA